MLTVSPEVASAVLNNRRAAVNAIEQETGKTILVRTNPAFGMDQLATEFEDPRGRLITIRI
jgi:hypothetical protein